MPKVDVINAEKSVVKSLDLSDEVFAAEIKEPLVHQVVVAQLNARRAGTHKTKGRSEIRGGGAKPWRQKGTGRARAGTNNSPLWRGGGTIFGPTPRDYSQSVNKKMKKAALKSALSSIVADNRLVVVDSLSMDAIKTKAAVDMLAKIDERKPVLVVHGEGCENFVRSVRNVPYVRTVPAVGVNVYDLLWADVVIATGDAVEAVEKRF